MEKTQREAIAAAVDARMRSFERIGGTKATFGRACGRERVEHGPDIGGVAAGSAPEILDGEADAAPSRVDERLLIRGLAPSARADEGTTFRVYLFDRESRF